MKCDRLLRAHHDRVDEAPQQHQQPKEDVHDADVLVIDAGNPFVPQIWKPAFRDDPYQNRKAGKDDDRTRNEGNWLIERDRVPTELSKHYRCPPRGITFWAPPRPSCGPSPGGSFCAAIASNSAGSTPRKVYGFTAELCFRSWLMASRSSGAPFTPATQLSNCAGETAVGSKRMSGN